MSLKQDIVVVNEYTIKTSKGGTRGGTPGDYVLRYMGRDGATEGVSPVRKMDEQGYILRYMARASAVDNAITIESDGFGVEQLKDDFYDIQGQGGIAFGYGDVSMSNAKLKKCAKDIQKQFDSGKTVLKTVLSFTDEYLKKHGIVDSEFVLEHEGDYRGNIDQMKLRMAIMSGMDKLARSYDDLQYIGVIQVDAKHVHCHLAMVDRGKGIVMPDGTQRGKLTDKEKRDVRRGIDMYLDEYQTVKRMTSSFDHDKRNTLCFIKQYTTQIMSERGVPQFLLACLPENKNLWRVSTNRREMRKPNEIVRHYVEGILSEDGSGYDDAMQRVEDYARYRTDFEGESQSFYDGIVETGRNNIVEEAMNSVYTVLKTIPTEDIEISTPMMNHMSGSFEEVFTSVQNGDLSAEFSFRMRSYKGRLDSHRSERRKYHEAVEDYEKEMQQNNYDEQSRVLYDFFKIEEEYNEMLVVKYRHFLSFMPSDDDYMEDFESYKSYKQRVENMRRMVEDDAFTKMRGENAERYGIDKYGEAGGSDMVFNPKAVRERLENMEDELISRRDFLMAKLDDYGFSMDENEENIVDSHKYTFEDVKALDLHHLAYDFSGDFSVSARNADNFVQMADRRYQAFDDARDYLIRTGQQQALAEFPGADIERQHAIAERFRSDNILYSERGQVQAVDYVPVHRTVPLDYGLYAEQELEIRNLIRDNVNSLQYDR